MNWLDDCIRRCRQEAINEVKARDRFGLGAAIPPEFGPDSAEGAQRPILVQREPNNVLLFCLRISLQRVFSKAVERDYVMLPGMKQRIEVPSEPLIGQTIVRPVRFGSVITASSGTSIHSLSRRTR